MGPSIFVLVLLAFFQIANGAPISENSALLYLSKYGYLAENTKNLFKSRYSTDRKVLRDAIAEFQGFSGLNATGELDDETLKTMSLPRCGVKDKVGSRSGSRSKRYARLGTPWGKKDITYKIVNYPETMAKEDVAAEIARAFAMWSAYTDLTFTPSWGQVDITIGFARYAHGDRDAFDGPEGVLAHAIQPVAEGSYVHFDASEYWTSYSSTGINLFQVATHEFGHALGLGHTLDQSAVMREHSFKYSRDFHLAEDDIRGIQALYGQKTRSNGFGRDDNYGDTGFGEDNNYGNTGFGEGNNYGDTAFGEDNNYKYKWGNNYNGGWYYYYYYYY